MVERFGRDLLRREISVFAFERDARLRPAEGAGAGDAEVAELHVAALREVDVRRSHVAVNDPERLTRAVGEPMNARQGFAELARDVHGE